MHVKEIEKLEITIKLSELLEKYGLKGYKVVNNYFFEDNTKTPLVLSLTIEKVTGEKSDG